MQVYVFDTYVKSRQNQIMHFDVLLPVNDTSQAIQAAKSWLATIGENDATVTSRECRYCH